MKKYHNYQGKDFTFIICAYGQCEYLEEAIESLEAQTVKGMTIRISTSTPNEYIKKIAEKHGIEIRVNPEGGQIKDYNFAMKQSDTDILMLMHQDEVILPEFVEESLNGLNSVKRPIISFTDYIEMHNDVVDTEASKMVKIKRMLLGPAKWRWLLTTKFGKRLIQRMGCPITHPSVVCVKKEMPDVCFREEFKASMDWDLWERLSKQDGAFVYVNKVLLHHRMNDENQTVKLLKTTNVRYEEEYDIFQRFWPKSIAKLIMHYYSGASKYY